MKIGTPLLLVLLSASAVRSQQADTASKVKAWVEEIFELDGTNEALRNRVLVHEADVRMQERYGWVSPEQVETAEEWIRIMFAGPEFPRDYMHGFTEDFDEGHAQAVIQWLRSPLTKRFQSLESVGHRPGTMEQVNEFLNSPRFAQVTEERKMILKDFAEFTRCPQEQLETMVARELARESVRNRFRKPEERLTEDDFKRMADTLRKNQREGLANGCWMPLLYVYRDVSDAELKKYLSFYETEAGRWYLQAHRQARRQAWVAGGVRLGQAGFTWPELPAEP